MTTESEMPALMKIAYALSQVLYNTAAEGTPSHEDEFEIDPALFEFDGLLMALALAFEHPEYARAAYLEVSETVRGESMRGGLRELIALVPIGGQQ